VDSKKLSIQLNLAQHREWSRLNDTTLHLNIKQRYFKQ